MTTTAAETAPLLQHEEDPNWLALKGLAVLCDLNPEGQGLPMMLSIDFHDRFKPMIRVAPGHLDAWLEYLEVPLPTWTVEPVAPDHLLAVWPSDVWAAVFVELNCTKSVTCNQILEHRRCAGPGCTLWVCPDECEGFALWACAHGEWALCPEHIYTCVECRADGKAGEHA